jgi:hypothetical protein
VSYIPLTVPHDEGSEWVLGGAVWRVEKLLRDSLELVFVCELGPAAPGRFQRVLMSLTVFLNLAVPKP